MENCIPQKTKNGTTMWSSSSTPGYTYSEKIKILTQENTCNMIYSFRIFTRDMQNSSEENNKESIFESE